MLFYILIIIILTSSITAWMGYRGDVYSSQLKKELKTRHHRYETMRLARTTDAEHKSHTNDEDE